MLSLIFLFALPAWAGQGWYLLVPWEKGPHPQPVSFAMWDHRSYDTALDCEYDLTRQVERREQRIKLGKDTAKEREINQRVLDRLTWARCIASDDPRLK
jgi:hypothetical protein